MWPRGERLAARPVREHGGGRLQLRRATTRHGEGSGQRGGPTGAGESARGAGATPSSGPQDGRPGGDLVSGAWGSLLKTEQASASPLSLSGSRRGGLASYSCVSRWRMGPPEHEMGARRAFCAAWTVDAVMQVPGVPVHSLGRWGGGSSEWDVHWEAELRSGEQACGGCPEKAE